MSRVIKINFTDVNFHIKEFQKVYILENCKLYFYSPFHLQTEDKNNGKKFEDKNGTIHQEKEIEKINSQDQSNEKADITKEQAKDYAQKIDKEINKLDENNFASNIQTQSIEKRQDKFKDYDIFYDVYTSKDNDIKSLNEELKYNDGFEVKDGIATVKADFFDKCFEEKKYILIPRLVSLEKNETLHFDPAPLEDKGFVVTDFRKGKKDEKNIDLSFQRSIAKIKNPNLTLQSPKEFLQVLNDNRDFTEDDKKEQAQAIQEACAKKADEMTKILLKDDESLKDIITDKQELKKKISELQKEPKTNEKLSLLGRLEFLQRNQDKAEKHKDMIDQLQNPQQASDDKKDDADDDFSDSRTNSTTPNQEEQKNKTINSKDIGDAGEYAASMLFTKRSTRYLSNRRKLDANFNTKGFNHTIPDFLVTLNDYPTLVEVKNVKDQALTEQISFELKLAREYELDYLFLCNHYTKLIDNITNLEIFNKGDEDHKGSRSGFIYHRHAHRSIKTIFKEMYLHHIKGATPNKIMIKRLNLNDPANIEEELNKNKQIQKN
ncbi:restriction endonuclease fold toxin 7 family protein [Campylobacter subantarcticus LMG 24377]|uniref:putative toxin n=1 Tax=Campylobacter subantarcticus TaxID=497724 RepID=UPI000581EA5D|nr:putative toxin [Campylobacter subantarcticus]AJC92628.1 restriction endonuclease fold toxin 7 family protein [Campylobacter subantarcticus LMG 24377]